MVEHLGVFTFFVTGAIFGSFGNVLIYRIPEKLSIVDPPSFCPNCRTRIRWYDNIPLVSFVLLKGRCRFCNAKIPFRYFFVELLTALAFSTAYLKAGDIVEAVFGSILFFYLIVVSFIDLEKRIIPDKINYGFFIISMLAIAIASLCGSQTIPLTGKRGFLPSLSGILLISLFFLAIDWFSYRFFKKPGIGFGDVKMGVNIGLYTGYYSLMVPLLAYAIATVFTPALTRRFKDGYIPFGPFLALSTFLVVLYGPEMLRAYMSLVGLQNQP